MPNPFWNQTSTTILQNLGSSESGLSGKLASRRLSERQKAEKHPPEWLQTLRLFARQFASPLVLLLVFAAILSASMSDWSNAVILISILFLTGSLSFWQEYRAGKAVQQLRAMMHIKCTVLRNGKPFKVPKETVVPGDVVPYDFLRKRLSMVVQDGAKDLMITKGAISEMLAVCDRVEMPDGSIVAIEGVRKVLMKHFETQSAQGYRTIGIAWKDLTGDPVINKDDETGMVFLGFLLLEDPPREDIPNTLLSLANLGITLKIITGDNHLAAAHLARTIGIEGSPGTTFPASVMRPSPVGWNPPTCSPKSSLNKKKDSSVPFARTAMW